MPVHPRGLGQRLCRSAPVPQSHSWRRPRTSCFADLAARPHRSWGEALTELSKGLETPRMSAGGPRSLGTVGSPARPLPGPGLSSHPREPPAPRRTPGPPQAPPRSRPARGSCILLALLRLGVCEGGAVRRGLAHLQPSAEASLPPLHHVVLQGPAPVVRRGPPAEADASPVAVLHLQGALWGLRLVWGAPRGAGEGGSEGPQGRGAGLLLSADEPARGWMSWVGITSQRPWSPPPTCTPPEGDTECTSPEPRWARSSAHRQSHLTGTTQVWGPPPTQRHP